MAYLRYMRCTEARRQFVIKDLRTTIILFMSPQREQHLTSYQTQLEPENYVTYLNCQEVVDCSERTHSIGLMENSFCSFRQVSEFPDTLQAVKTLFLQIPYHLKVLKQIIAKLKCESQKSRIIDEDFIAVKLRHIRSRELIMLSSVIRETNNFA